MGDCFFLFRPYKWSYGPLHITGDGDHLVVPVLVEHIREQIKSSGYFMLYDFHP